MWLQNVHLKKQKGSKAHSRAVIQKVAPFHIYIKFAFLIPRSDFTSRAMCNKNSCLNNLNPQIRRVTSTLEERVQRSQEQRAGASKFSTTSSMLKLVFAVKEAHVLVCFFFAGSSRAPTSAPAGSRSSWPWTCAKRSTSTAWSTTPTASKTPPLLLPASSGKDSLSTWRKVCIRSSEGQLHPASPNHNAAGPCWKFISNARVQV